MNRGSLIMLSVLVGLVACASLVYIVKHAGGLSRPYLSLRESADKADVMAETIANQTEEVQATGETQLAPPVEVMAWIYPGEPSCGARSELSDGREIDILKAEYFSVDESGDLTFLTEDRSGCNGYSPENIAILKKFSREQYVTISASYTKSLDIFLRRSVADSADVDRLVEFVVANDLTGAELDFEDFGGWDRELYSRYKAFVEKLGSSLRDHGKRLMIDGPAIQGEEESRWYVWRYQDFMTLPVHRIVIMAYDYQFDHGLRSPVMPFEWATRVIQYTLAAFPDATRLSIGIPSYGYRGEIESGKITILTYDQMSRIPGFERAKRDSASGEMSWSDAANVYYFQDSESLARKRALVESSGIASISVWHLGGNRWFAKE